MLVSQEAMTVRKMLERDFATAFPNGFRALQDMALAGSKAYKSNGKRAWFGLGRDLTLEVMRGYRDSIMLFVMAMGKDEFINLPAAVEKGIPPHQQLDHTVKLFFIAYPNWPDAEESWESIGRTVMYEALRVSGY